VREITREMEIHASSERVWSILTDLNQFHEWNPFIRKAAGEVRGGGKLTFGITPSGGNEMNVNRQ